MRPATKQNEVFEQVLGLIERLDVGQAIPPERQLSADLGVARPTLRVALDRLVREGYLVRRRGSGSFVSRPKIAQELTVTSFSEDMRRRGMVPANRTIELKVTSAGARLGHILRVSPAEPIVVAQRLRLADGDTMAIETLHVPQALVPGLEPHDLETGSFYELLESRYGIVIASGAQTIEPTVTSEEESDALGVPLHSPAFLFQRTSCSQNGQVVEFVRSIYRGDRYKLVAELSHHAVRERRSAAPLAGTTSGARGR
jgi:GntR family transcriptional regulator